MGLLPSTLGNEAGAKGLHGMFCSSGGVCVCVCVCVRPDGRY